MQTFCGITTDGMLDYLATIQKMSGYGDKITTSGLAERMHVSPAAASSMLKRLEETGFVERSTTDGVTLTHQGRLAAMQLIRRHRLLEVFLIDVMGYTWDQVDVEAHKLQHSISSYFEERMDELCHFPTHCPHGDPIPRKDGTMPSESLLSVVALQPGQKGILRRVGSTDARVLRYLTQLDLMPGRTIQLIEKAPFSGPVTLDVYGADIPHSTKILGSELADQLFVLV